MLFYADIYIVDVRKYEEKSQESQRGENAVVSIDLSH